MKTRLHWIGAMSLAATLAATVSPAAAQSPRPWVDPPSEPGSSTPGSAPAQDTHESKPTAPQPTASPNASAAPKTEAPKTDVGRTQEAQQNPNASPSSAQRKPAAKNTSQRSVKASRSRRSPQEVTTARSERARPLPRRRDVAEQRTDSTRAARLREGVNSGLEVMNLRTIELPDGRRIQILTRPQPGTMSELLDRDQ